MIQDHKPNTRAHGAVKIDIILFTEECMRHCNVQILNLATIVESAALSVLPLGLFCYMVTEKGSSGFLRYSL